jgi:hypothetical protein
MISYSYFLFLMRGGKARLFCRPSLAGFVPLHNRCQPLPRVARVDGTPAKPGVHIRSKARGLESASHTRFEENVASATPRRIAVEAKTKRLVLIPSDLNRSKTQKGGKNGGY